MLKSVTSSHKALGLYAQRRLGPWNKGQFLPCSAVFYLCCTPCLAGSRFGWNTSSTILRDFQSSQTTRFIPPFLDWWHRCRLSTTCTHADCQQRGHRKPKEFSIKEILHVIEKSIETVSSVFLQDPKPCPLSKKEPPLTPSCVFSLWYRSELQKNRGFEISLDFPRGAQDSLRKPVYQKYVWTWILQSHRWLS